MTNHTADTLKYYLGRDVWCSSQKQTMKIIGFNIEQDYSVMTHYAGTTYNFLPEFIYPILKTAEELSEEELEEIFIFLWHYYDAEDYIVDEYFMPRDKDFDDSILEYNHIQKLLSKGYGAIPNEDSPTGYMDLFGMPCVTPISRLRRGWSCE